MTHPGIPAEYLNQVVTGDAKELAARLPDGSVDLIFCDPVYWNSDDYRWLAGLAARVLVEGGCLFAQSGELFLHENGAAVREETGLIHMPPVIEVYHFSLKAFQVGPTRISSGYTPYIFATKGPRKLSIMNRYFGKLDKRIHEWGDGAAFALKYVSVLCNRGDVVLDPFTGGGTVPAVCKMLDRQYIAFEIDPVTAAKARERVDNAQVPLWTPEPVQAKIFAT